MVDLWSGIGGLPLTLLSLGVHFYCVSPEWDESARQVAASCMPRIVHLHDTAQVRGRERNKFWIRRRPGAILIGGGSP